MVVALIGKCDLKLREFEFERAVRDLMALFEKKWPRVVLVLCTLLPAIDDEK